MVKFIKKTFKQITYIISGTKALTRACLLTLLCFLGMSACYPPHAEADELVSALNVSDSIGEYSKLKVPRFVSLRSETSNMRTGPGPKYPIEWIYKRANLPVKVTREFSKYYLIIDPYGVQGWMDEALISPRRTFVIVGRRTYLRDNPDYSANHIADLQIGVIGNVINCKLNSYWCQVKVNSYVGWVQRVMMWGVGKDEPVGN